jgi:hypothetical protein
LKSNLRIASVLCALTLLASCTADRAARADAANRAQVEMIGMSKKDLLLCAGVPVREAHAEDLEFLSYSAGGDSVGGGVAVATSPNTAVAVGSSHRRYCEATFALKDGIVQKVTYQGRTGGVFFKGEECGFIVENCVKR